MLKHILFHELFDQIVYSVRDNFFIRNYSVTYIILHKYKYSYCGQIDWLILYIYLIMILYSYYN